MPLVDLSLYTSLSLTPHHLNCVLLDPGSRCASPLSIDGVAFGVVTWLTSRIPTVQVGQTVLDHYTSGYLGCSSEALSDPNLPELCRLSMMRVAAIGKLVRIRASSSGVGLA